MRMAEKETLYLRATLRAEPIDLGTGFSPLGGRCYTEFGAKLDNRANEARVIGSSRKAAYKGPIDFDFVEGEITQPIERGMADAEIIDREEHTQAAKLVQRSQKSVVWQGLDCLGDFQFEASGVEVCSPQRVVHDLRKIASDKLSSRNVDRHPGATGPGRGLGERRAQYPPPEARHKPEFFDKTDELSG